MKARIVQLLCFSSLCLLLLTATGYGGGIKADLLVGKWEFVKSPPQAPKDVTIEFTKKGTVHVSFTGKDGQVIKKDAKYKVDGNKLTISETGGKEETSTIKSLTRSELVVQNNKGEEVKLRRKGAPEDKK